MSREILTDRWFLGGCGFLIAFGIACYFWYQHELAPYRRDLAASEERLRQWEQYKVAQKKFQKEKEKTPISNEPDILKEDAKRNNTIVETEDVVEGRVSPHGFGPYPELPSEWKEAVVRRGESFLWDPEDPKGELMLRVQAELLKQGIPAVGSMMDKGLVYPIISGVRYVEFEWSGIRRYITTSIGTPKDGDRLRAIKKAIGRPLTAADVPSDILLVPYKEAGIDPYTFLDLP